LLTAKQKKIISGKVFIDADKEGFTSIPENPAVLKIRKGNSVIRAESKDYKPVVVSVKDVEKSRNIEMEKITVGVGADPVPLSLAGSTPWDLRISARNNEVIVNGSLDDAGGFYKNGLQAALRGKTLILYFSNVDRSEFSLMSRMVRITYNKNDTTLIPTNESTSNGGFIPVNETPDGKGIEYPIPDNFDGKLGFVFFQANLNDLRITAFVR